MHQREACRSREATTVDSAVGPTPAAGAPERGKGRLYLSPIGRDAAQDANPPRPWPDVAAEFGQIVVLPHPGLGKSWPVRILLALGSGLQGRMALAEAGDVGFRWRRTC